MNYGPIGRRVGRIGVRCVGGCMDGRTISSGIASQFFRVLSQRGREQRGYCPDVPVHSYRLETLPSGEAVYVLESSTK